MLLAERMNQPFFSSVWGVDLHSLAETLWLNKRQQRKVLESVGDWTMEDSHGHAQ